MESHTAADAATHSSLRRASECSLSASVVLRESIDEQLVGEMYRLYSANYLDTTPELFGSDLEAKSHVLMLRNDDNELCGFTTIQFYSSVVDHAAVRVIYSGDTIIAPAYWGSQALAFEWIRFAGELYRQAPEIPLYWLLIVKGHRTYRFLPAFARQYLPHHAMPASENELRTREVLAREKFGDHFNARSGVVRFPSCLGRLKAALAEIPDRHLRLPEVAHFLALNPDYRKGDELVCLCRLAPDNLRPRAARLFAEPASHAGLN
jgi:hypothetical protein